LKNNRPKKRDNLLYRELDGEGIIYDQENSMVHTLNPTATLIWNYCDGKQSTKDIAKKLIKKYDTSLDNALKDIEKTLKNLKNLKLLME
jgi:hypothetical protein